MTANLSPSSPLDVQALQARIVGAIDGGARGLVKSKAFEALDQIVAEVARLQSSSVRPTGEEFIQVGGGNWECEKCGESFHASEIHECAGGSSLRETPEVKL